jgi:hypothetical protein
MVRSGSLQDRSQGRGCHGSVGKTARGPCKLRLQVDRALAADSRCPGEQRLADAVEYGRALLHPTQKRLPDPLTAMLVTTIAEFDEGRPEPAQRRFQEAVELARQMAYL